MLTILSPAKKLNEESQDTTNCSTPIFVDDAAKLITTLRKYNPKKLGNLMKLSDSLAALNVNRYATWNIDHTKGTIPAALTFNGEVYAGLDAASFSEKEQIIAQIVIWEL